MKKFTLFFATLIVLTTSSLVNAKSTTQVQKNNGDVCVQRGTIYMCF
jgi:hypothetical protein